MSGFSGAAETANTAFAVAEFLDDVKAHLQHRHDNQLRQAFHGIERESALAPVPGRYHQLALVIGIDEADHYTIKNCLNFLTA